MPGKHDVHLLVDYDIYCKFKLLSGEKNITDLLEELMLGYIREHNPTIIIDDNNPLTQEYKEAREKVQEVESKMDKERRLLEEEVRRKRENEKCVHCGEKLGMLKSHLCSNGRFLCNGCYFTLDSQTLRTYFFINKER